jgi:hypothetical protein
MLAEGLGPAAPELREPEAFQEAVPDILWILDLGMANEVDDCGHGRGP